MSRLTSAERLFVALECPYHLATRVVSALEGDPAALERLLDAAEAARGRRTPPALLAERFGAR